MRKTIAVILIAVFFISMGWLGWTYYGTTYTAQRHTETLVEAWEKESGTCTAVKGVDALLRIPAIKLTVPVVASMDQDVLDSGVAGAYPGQPGKGNYALAGHRITHGEPFRNLPNLGNGNRIIVEYRCKTYVYTVVDNFEVPMSDVSVLLPVGEPVITLVTCASLFHTDDRTVVRGVLSSISRR